MARVGTVWGVRLVEWSILALVVLALAWALGRYAQRVHAQAERAAVLSTLGAIRTAMVIEHLQRKVQGSSASSATSLGNPFDTARNYPPNYAGEVQGRNVRHVAPGQWVFDPQCACIGYKPLYAEGLQSLDRLDTLWFQRRTQGDVGTLAPLDRYVWFGQAVE